VSWTRIDEASAELSALVRTHLPAIVPWADDPWQNPPFVLYRAARDGERVQFALHYTWLAPTWPKLCAAHPGWSSERKLAAMRALLKHERDWGPGDLELVTVTIGAGGALESLDLRLRLRLQDFPGALWRWIRRQPTERRQGFAGAVFGGARPVLVAAASEHHEWQRPRPRRPRPADTATVPWAEPLTQTLWRTYELESGGPAGRAHLDWERGQPTA
jgi:hypothetical protein